jgi:hypothetical protein
MKFNRLQLIKLIDEEVIRREKATAQKAQADLEAYTDRRADWHEKYRDAWRDFRDAIDRSLELGDPMLWDDVPPDLIERHGGGRLNFWTDRVPEKSPKPYLGDLPAVKALLEAATGDEEVTAAELMRMGFKVSTLFPR